MFSFTKYGKYPISITATNNIPASPPPTLTSKVQALSDIGEILIQLDPAPTIENVLEIATSQNFEIDVSVTFKQAVNYTFDFGDAVRKFFTEYGYTKVTHQYKTKTDVNITITAQVEGYSEKRLVRVIARLCGPPAIYFPNSYTADDPQIVTKGTPIDFLKTRVEKTADCRGDPEYLWNISPPPIQKVSESDKQKAYFKFEAGSLNIGDYSVTLNVSYSESSTGKEKKYYYKTHLRVVSSPLVASISGGSFREVDSSVNSTKLELNASKSTDPDNENSPNLTFKWMCKFENNLVPPVPHELCNSTVFVKLPGTGNQKIVNLDIDKFRENVTYVFRVTVSDQEHSRNQSAQQRVKLLPNIPSLEIR